jgi:hypothetical protein
MGKWCTYPELLVLTNSSLGHRSGIRLEAYSEARSGVTIVPLEIRPIRGSEYCEPEMGAILPIRVNIFEQGEEPRPMRTCPFDTQCPCAADLGPATSTHGVPLSFHMLFPTSPHMGLGFNFDRDARGNSLDSRGGILGLEKAPTPSACVGASPGD